MFFFDMNLSPQSSTSVASELDRQCWFFNCQTRGSLDLRMRQGKCQPASNGFSQSLLKSWLGMRVPHGHISATQVGAQVASGRPTARDSRIFHACARWRGGRVPLAMLIAPHEFRICSAYVPHMFHIFSA